MKRTQRMQRFDHLFSPPFTLEEIQRLLAEGWRPVSILWEAPEHLVAAEGEAQPSGLESSIAAVPFGLQIAENCQQLEVNPAEAEVLFLMMEMTSTDARDAEIAQELNRRGFRTREGWPWTSVSVFRILPRLIEAGPGILGSEQWRLRHKSMGSSSPSSSSKPS